MSGYDVFLREKGWRVEKMLIISPYVEQRFFAELLDRLRPKHLHVVIDDGCREGEMELVRRAVEERAKGSKFPRLHLRQGTALGLVHAKLFYVCERSTTGRLRRSLVYGSGNATEQGFHGGINAEAIATCRLFETNHRDAIEWFESVVAATEKTRRINIEALRDVQIAKGCLLHLPGFAVRGSSSKSSSFDLWLQRGRLLSVYRPEPSFLAVPIALKKALPADILAQQTEKAGFKTPLRRQLRYPYLAEATVLEAEEEENNGASVGHWRRRYFTWTQLGDWCSEGSYEECQSQFVRSGSEDRQAAVDALRELGDRRKISRVADGFVSAIENLWSLYGGRAVEYLRGGKHGPDIAFYRTELKKRVDRDCVWASDREFVQRFVSGFELTEVPRFRSDPIGWEEFSLSLCRQLLLDLRKARQTSLLSKTVIDLSEQAEEAGSAAELLATLRKLWQLKIDPTDDETFGQSVAKYHSYWT